MSRYGITNEGTLIVDRPIGTVNVTASRESLALTASQESDLDSAIRAAIEDLNLKVRETYHSLGSEIERARFAYANTSLLGRGDWPTSVQTPWPMLKFDQGALVPYDRFHVATMEKVVIVWDDGTRIPRRTLRLRALARSGKSVYVEIDRSKVSAVRQLLQLESRQIIKIDSIPDVHINRTASSAGRVKKTVEQGSVWVPCNRNRVSAGPLGWVRGKENFGHMIGGGRTLGMANVVWVESVIAEASAGKPLLYLTSVEIERALAKGKINPDLRLDLVLCRRLNDESLLQTVRDLMLHQAMGSHVRSDSVRTVMLERLGAPIIAPSQPLMPFYRSLLPEVISGYEREVNSQIADLAERFPLLFRFDTQAALDYIAMCDASAAELAASQ